VTPRPLEDAMERVAADDSEENRVRLYQLLLEAELLVPTDERPTEERTLVATGEESWTVRVLGEDDQGLVVPVFTDVERMLEWEPDGSGYIALEGRALFELAEMNGFGRLVVNPGSATLGAIERHEIETLARGRLPVEGAEQIPAGSRVRIGQAAVRPSAGAIDAVRAALAADQRISGAWLLQIQQPPAAPEHAVAVAFGDDLDDASRSDAFQAVARRAGQHSTEARDFLFVPVDATLKEIGEPIFER
jgi:hypothetical protein